MTTAAALATATPVEIDTALAEIYSRYYEMQDKAAQHQRFIDDLVQGLEKAKAGDARYQGTYTQKSLDEQIRLRDGRLDEATKILAEAAPYEAEFLRRPWTRFFLVKNNGGHVHSSMSCSTCFPTTRFGWLPDLSGQTEAEAVAAHGAILCTICYPSAPTEWTDRHDDSVCPGSGQYLNRDLPHRAGFYSGNWATCETCGERVTIVKSGKIRKHKKP